MRHNTAYIYQPKFKEEEFWVACHLQEHPDHNFIIVTCSEHYNGVYMWKKGDEIGMMSNGKMSCYRVPICKCQYIKSLKELTAEDVIKKVIKYQKAWCKGQVKNNNYIYKTKPDWAIY